MSVRWRNTLTVILLPLLFVAGSQALAAGVSSDDPSDKLALYCTDPPPNLVGWWPLDETSGSTSLDLIDANHGEHVGAPSPTTGVVDGALYFDGVGDSVEVADTPLLDFGLGDFSIDLWIQTADATRGVQTILDKRVLTPSVRGYHLFTWKGFLGFQLADGTKTNYISDVFVADGRPHHVAVTVARDDPNGLRLYVDGITVKTATPRDGFLSNAAPLTLGARSNRTGFWDGILDEVEIFNRALSVFEVSAIALAGRNGKCKCASPGCRPVAWWPFDSQPGGSGKDIAHHPTGPHDGLIEGPGLATGRVGGGLSFDGVDDLVSVPSRAGLDIDLAKPGAFTIDTWVKTIQDETILISKSYIGCCHDIPLGYFLFLRSGLPGFGISSTTDGRDFFGAGGVCASTACFPLSDGEWHLLGATVTHDAGGRNLSIRLYVDGRLVHTFPETDLDGSAEGGRFEIGALTFAQLPGFFEGKLDEVEVFDRALTEADFSAIYGAGSAGKCRADPEVQVCGTRGALPCFGGTFCDFSPASQCGANDGGGVCRPIPEICFFNYDPVCGCDGETYSNECIAHSSGISVAHKGPC